ncbi:glycosyltransferase family 2 protein [Candidatus Aminicenantes bacterium AC-708-M15]|jgi:glycosyltransferase involved in cell wall biosynthesis|nr:glycosyltransferase family 2 protein [SCandidatus Aminicenantes bacterium Aminicenantia_JdfR_composite]MCP2596804.1 glycosyltransferase family 2 protein [Candidatus Aminicenantes bacterium AC-335-G13]MCP2598265.1 glycosyltransferase family 2 protein [Candidatus Aminicenantes bacterium AC-335-L06]MCP2604004.1 glycosyltransferase family 2 protein [Candidatus Aminicenantes bacterium AC-708-M15]MCP2618503.1 glycosyltransferase family 2 protein [Candidatus Aminicenantes bacterium AC-335-A11]
MKISVTIITFNEEEKIEGAIKSVLDIADEIIIVDSFSVDNTVKIAKKYRVKVYQKRWQDYADQRNFALEKASHPWVLNIDADERVSPELKKEILDLKSKEPEYDGFSIPRLTYYLNRWIYHSGWYPDRKIRLFKKQMAKWEGRFIHEKLIFTGKVGKLKNPVYHFSYKNIEEHLSRINKYSSLGARKLYENGKKARWYHFIIYPFFRFIKSYILKLGFLDGFAGFIISVLNSYYIFTRYAKLKEIWKKGEKIETFPH